MTTKPMTPEITLDDSRVPSTCNCCGTEDGTVKLLRFRWTLPKQRQGGGTTVALCAECRTLTRAALERSIA